MVVHLFIDNHDHRLSSFQKISVRVLTNETTSYSLYTRLQLVVFDKKEDKCMEIQLGMIEARFADMIWEHEPVTSSELVKMTAVEFNWKRSTAHTVLRRLIAKGIFQNENGLVTAIVSREEFYSRQSRQYVEDTFAGSLPAFIAAFTQNSRLTPEEADAIRRMIDNAEEK